MRKQRAPARPRFCVVVFNIKNVCWGIEATTSGAFRTLKGLFYPHRRKIELSRSDLIRVDKIAQLVRLKMMTCDGVDVAASRPRTSRLVLGSITRPPSFDVSVIDLDPRSLFKYYPYHFQLI